VQVHAQERAGKSLAEHREDMQRPRQAQIDLKSSEATFAKLISDNTSTSAFSTADLYTTLQNIKQPK
jgi:hypothetical protein